MRNDLAKQHHEGFRESIAQAWSHVAENSTAAIKSLFLINGGAVLSLMTSLPKLTETEALRGVDEVWQAMIIFTLGVGFATLCALLSYVAEYCYVQEQENIKYTWQRPFYEETATSKSWIKWAYFFHILIGVSALCSFLCFAMGVLDMSTVLQALFNSEVADAAKGTLPVH